MDKMREAFEEHAYCWAASFTRSEEEYCDDEVNSAWLYFKAGAAWQAAQSAAVPVVGEVVAWLVDKPLRHVNMSKSIPIGLGNATQEPLYRAPTHSITAAELDALRKDAERYRNALIVAFQHIDQSTHCKDHALVAAAIAGEGRESK